MVLKAKEMFCPSDGTHHEGLTTENEEESLKRCRRVERGYTTTRFYHLGGERQSLLRAKPCPEA